MDVTALKQEMSEFHMSSTINRKKISKRLLISRRKNTAKFRVMTVRNSGMGISFLMILKYNDLIL
jgi:hypothetical protein